MTEFTHGTEPEHVVLWQLGVMLAAIVVVLLGAHRLRINPVIGYLLLGVMLGPHGLRLIESAPALHAAAELGIAFLLFTIGLELSLQRLGALAKDVFGLGGLQMTLTGAALTLGAHAFGLDLQAAALIGFGLALSSTAVVMDVLHGSREEATPLGRTAFAILLFQDLTSVPLLVLVGLSRGDDPAVALLAWALGSGFVTILGIIFFGHLVLRPLFDRAGSARSSELFLATTLLAVVATVTVADAAGLSGAMGAFLAGLLLAETDHRHRIEIDIEPFRGLLIGVFFITVGMGLEPGVLVANAGPIAIALPTFILLKAAILTLLCRLTGRGWDTAARIGLLLGGGGEFALVLFGIGAGSGLLPAGLAQGAIALTAISMMLTPLIDVLGRRLARSLPQTASNGRTDSEEESKAPEKHVVIVGMSHVGRTVAKILRQRGYAVFGVDLDARRVANGRANGLTAITGDARRRELHHRLHLDRAIGVIITIGDPHAAQAVVAEISKTYRELPMVVRTRRMGLEAAAQSSDGRSSEQSAAAAASQIVPVPEDDVAAIALATTLLDRLEADGHVGEKQLDHAGGQEI
jgi:CPA2 family monovalent cation:H+ antiporter-2